MSFFGSLFSSGMASREAAKNREFQERAIKHRYQWQKQDLLKAGYNPALAYGQQPPGPPGGAQAAWNVQGDPVSDVATAKKAWADAKTAMTEAEERPSVLKAQVEGVDAAIEEASEKSITENRKQDLLEQQTAAQRMQNKIMSADAIIGQATAGAISKLPTWGQIGYGVLKNVAPAAAGAAARRFGR